MGYFDEELEDIGPESFRVGDGFKRQVGDFFLAWARLDAELDVAFHILFRIDPNLASCIYSNLSTQAKIDIIASATDTLWNALGKTRVERMHSHLEKIRRLNDRARNTLAHGQYYLVPDEKTKKLRPAVVRSRAKKQMVLVVHPGDTKYWRRMTIAVGMAKKSLRKILAEFHRQLKKFSDDQLWESTGLQQKLAEPIFLRRRKRGVKRGASP